MNTIDKLRVYSDVKKMIANQIEASQYKVYDITNDATIEGDVITTKELEDTRYDVRLPADIDAKIVIWLAKLDDEAQKWAATAAYWVLEGDNRFNLTLEERIGRLVCLTRAESMSSVVDEV